MTRDEIIHRLAVGISVVDSRTHATEIHYGIEESKMAEDAIALIETAAATREQPTMVRHYVPVIMVIEAPEGKPPGSFFDHLTTPDDVPEGEAQLVCVINGPGNGRWRHDEAAIDAAKVFAASLDAVHPRSDGD